MSNQAGLVRNIQTNKQERTNTRNISNKFVSTFSSTGSTLVSNKKPGLLRRRLNIILLQMSARGSHLKSRLQIVIIAVVFSLTSSLPSQAGGYPF